MRATAFGAGFGSVGPVAPAPHPDCWVSIVVDVETDAPLSGVAIDGVELIDEAGEVVGRALPPWTLERDARSPGVERARWDLTATGTIAFDGEARPGRPLRLRFHAALDARAHSLMAAHPVRFRARVNGTGDAGTSVEGPLDGPWCTAGPAAVP